ncbi:MAG: endonuclease III [Candidatus Aenigmatarchaeota archaeon]
MQIEEIIKSINNIKEVKNAPVFRKIKIVDKDPFRIITFAVLSSRTKDEALIKVCKILFKKAKDFKDLIKMKRKDLESILYPIGFYKRKAMILKKLAKQIIKSKKLPDRLEEIVKLYGVGRKVGKVILNELYDSNVVAVDTHVHRISNRIGIINTKSIKESENMLEKIVPENLKKDLNKTLVAFGQTICKPKNPLCYKCPLKKACKYYLWKNTHFGHLK